MTTTKLTSGTKATILDWLEQLPVGYREQALENFDESRNSTSITVDCLSNAVYDAFSWEHSPQGFDYWYQIYEYCIRYESIDWNLPELWVPDK